ncbi:hypothetical protein QYE76_069391 [Lolium multiflorum]|uniref:Uncharacterized protein n=1 Tax=Lolium multiflorum TaxID=4521 RepID=A0AAD8WCK6_LOLMU|nr:hypothetical protein QYE76_069391 [Lolium multiflorum]
MAMETESSAPAHLLLGPPVIRGARPSADATDDGALAWHPFLDLLDLLDTRRHAPFGRRRRRRCTDVAPLPRPPRRRLQRALHRGDEGRAQAQRALTKNCSATYSGSVNPCLDFFFQVVPNTPPERVRELLATT